MVRQLIVHTSRLYVEIILGNTQKTFQWPSVEEILASTDVGGEFCRPAKSEFDM